MRLQLLRPPPIGAVDLSWRELYEREAFVQREMVGESRLRSVTKERDVKRTEGRLDIDKVVLAEALAECLVEKVMACAPEDLDALKKQRPIVGFVIDRVASALNRSRPAGSQP